MFESSPNRLSRTVVAAAAASLLIPLSGCSKDGSFSRNVTIGCPYLAAGTEIPTFPILESTNDGKIIFTCRPSETSLDIFAGANKKPLFIQIFDEEKKSTVSVPETVNFNNISNDGVFEVSIKLNADLPPNPDPIADVLTLAENHPEFAMLRTDTEYVEVTPLFANGDTPNIR